MLTLHKMSHCYYIGVVIFNLQFGHASTLFYYFFSISYCVCTYGFLPLAVLLRFVSSFNVCHVSRPNTPFAPPSDVRADPLSHVSNALSRMQLNSHSENLLEEKELEVI